MRDAIILGVIGLVIIGVLIGIILIPSYFEAKTFNKFTTGQKATVMDAFWARLRVEACD